MKKSILLLLCSVLSVGMCAQSAPAHPDSVHSHKLVWSIGTNLLYDVLAVPNLNADFYVGRNMSVNVSWMYGWWDKKSTHRYWRIYGGRLGGRYWLPKSADRAKLTGHHIGPYVSVFTYDFEFGDTGNMAGKPGGNILDRASYAFGVEYGYTLQLRPNLTMDFSIELGYSGGKYIVYKPEGPIYVWQATKQRHWWGPTGVSISLNWTFPRGHKEG